MENNNNFWVELEKTWFYVPEGEESLLKKYNTIGFTVYSILKRNVTTRNTIPVCVNVVADILQIDKHSNSYFIKKIKKSIISMNDHLFTIYEDTDCNNKLDMKDLNNNTTYYAKLSADPNKKDPFMMIYDNEIDILIEHAKDKKVSIEDLITHYAFICNGFKGKKDGEEYPEDYKCWYGTYESITKKIGLVKNTLVSNNKIFQELNLLLIGNAGGKLDSASNTYENTSNVYAKVGDKEYFDKYLEIKKGKINKAFERNKDKAEQDEQRRLKQLYKNYQKKLNVIDYADINNLEDEEYEKLQQLELAYLNFVKGRGKEPKNANFKTIRHDGTPIERYVSQEEKLEEIDMNQLESEASFKNDNWGGEEPPKDMDDMDDDFAEGEESYLTKEENENIRKDLFKYIKEQCKGNENIQDKFTKKFKNSGFKTVVGGDLLQLKEKVEFFFKKADYLDF